MKPRLIIIVLSAAALGLCLGWALGLHYGEVSVANHTLDVFGDVAKSVLGK